MQGVSQERKKLCVLHELGDKTQLGVLVGGRGGGALETLGLSGGPQSKALGTYTIFSSKLV